MIWEDLNENLIVPDLEAKSSDEVFEKLGGLFIAEGYCRDTYVDALKDREKDFPTGVNMGSIGIAIPHTDKQHVIKRWGGDRSLKRTGTFLPDGNNR